MTGRIRPTPGSAARTFTDAIKAVGAGHRKPLFDLLADDVRWSLMGVESWSRSYIGKSEVIEALFGGVDETPADQQEVELVAVVADGVQVVVEFSGFNTTATGVRYNNRYCWVATFDAGRLTELHEYTDTAMVSSVFGANAADAKG